MEKFLTVAPRISKEALTHTPLDLVRDELQQQAQQRMEQDPKFFIHQNMRVLHEIERDMKQANLGSRRPGTAKDRKSFYTGG